MVRAFNRELDRTFDNLGFLSNKFRQTLFYILRGQVH